MDVMLFLAKLWLQKEANLEFLQVTGDCIVTQRFLYSTLKLGLTREALFVTKGLVLGIYSPSGRFVEEITLPAFKLLRLLFTRQILRQELLCFSAV